MIVDSSVRVLRFESITARDAKDFIDAVARDSWKMRIEKLHLGGYLLVDAVWDGIIDCIPQFLYLVELSTGTPPKSAALLLESIRENGSLVSIPKWQYASAFNSCDVTRLSAYGKRNEFLPKLLGRTHLCTSSDEDERLSLFPSLFSVAKQTGRMGPNFLLLGLLTCTCSNTSNKRVRGDKRSSFQS
jgi:hypothetical protein